MSRTLPAGLTATLNDPFLIPVLFVRLEFDSAPLHLHTDLGTITTTDTSPNRVWTGTGDLGSVGPVEETDGVTPTGIEVSLSGIDSTLLDEARNQDYQDRPIYIYIGMRDAVTGALVSDIAEIFAGYMDQMIITSGRELSTITLSAESEQIRWTRSPAIYYDAATLQEAYAGETFFNYLPDMLNIQLRWGTNNPNVDLGARSPISLQNVVTNIAAGFF